MKFTNKIHSILVLLSLTILVSCSTEESIPQRELIVDSAIAEPTVGGPNQPNQVFFNLSDNTEVSTQRDGWDLRFYTGNDFRVSINSSIYMATKALQTNDINSVNTANTQNLFNTIAIGTFEADNVNYVDDFDGDINFTAIAEISDIHEENMVYLVNLGYDVPNTTPQTGSTAVAGNTRGWKKVRILKDGANYTLQYADLDDTTFQEVNITKDNNYNFIYFSFNTDQVVSIEPNKNDWDFCFTVFSNEILGFGTYGFTDFITTNNLQNVGAYLVMEDDISYADFSISNVDENSFDFTQRAIGSGWRLGGGPSSLPTVKPDLYYILKDTDGIIYKLKFTRLTNGSGERGFPEFRYDRL